MSPFKSTEGRSSGKFLRIFRNTDLNLRGYVRNIFPFSATGGTITTPGNGYKYHFFTSPGFFVVENGDRDVDYIIVGGGGGGGSDGPGNLGAGGGGAGGYRTGVVPTIIGSYPIEIGQGGATGVPEATPGGSSSAFSITAAGGGGGVYSNGTGKSGGSGGGSGYQGDGGSGNTPPVSPPQGNPGGSGAGSPGGTVPGSGGGGAGAAGEDSAPDTTSIGSRGGNGLPAFSGDTGIPPSYGTPGPTPGRWFAGGGGGGTPSGQSPSLCSAGGAGGGGRGSGPAGLALAGTTNTGGGGGAGHYTPAPKEGKSGGSGIVIVRYLE